MQERIRDSLDIVVLALINETWQTYLWVTGLHWSIINVHMVLKFEHIFMHPYNLVCLDNIHEYRRTMWMENLKCKILWAFYSNMHIRMCLQLLALKDTLHTINVYYVMEITFKNFYFYFLIKQLFFMLRHCFNNMKPWDMQVSIIEEILIHL